MSYDTYTKRYNKLIKRLIVLGLTYCRKVFWRLTRAQYLKYYRAQFNAMTQAIETLRG